MDQSVQWQRSWNEALTHWLSEQQRHAAIPEERQERSHPLEFDAAGFPVLQEPPPFDARVRRLLSE